jgi:hypothetical protein
MICSCVLKALRPRILDYALINLTGWSPEEAWFIHQLSNDHLLDEAVFDLNFSPALTNIRLIIDELTCSENLWVPGPSRALGSTSLH